MIGSVWQFRVKVPADLRTAFGREHVNHSLKTDSRSLAIRLSRKVAAEIDAMFEAKRVEIGLRAEDRLLASPSVAATVGKTIDRRSEKASPTTMGPTLSQVYDRYLADPTKRRSARTMLADQTTRRVVKDVLGAKATGSAPPIIAEPTGKSAWPWRNGGAITSTSFARGLRWCRSRRGSGNRSRKPQVVYDPRVTEEFRFSFNLF